MKALIFKNLMIGEAAMTTMPVATYHDWQIDRIVALKQALDIGKEKGASACVIAGGLFAPGFVSVALMEAALSVLEACDLEVFYHPYPTEALDAEILGLLPANVTLSRSRKDSPLKGLRLKEEDHDIRVYVAEPKGWKRRKMGNLEPRAFGERKPSGFLLVKIQKGEVQAEHWQPCAVHPFEERTVVFHQPQSSQEMTRLVLEAVDGISESSCVHLALRGSVPLEVTYRIDTVVEALSQRFFFVEVANECAVAIDEGALANDATLLGEFVRIVQDDESLSPVERARIVRCGWAVLNGREVAL